MDSEPDRSSWYLQGHFGTKAEADAYMADIEKVCGLQDEEAPRMEVTADREGGYNLWVCYND